MADTTGGIYNAMVGAQNSGNSSFWGGQRPYKAPRDPAKWSGNGLHVPKRANADLVFQARRQISQGRSYGSVSTKLQTSTARKPATAVAPGAPGAVAGSTARGFGGGGYSGAVSHVLGAPSNGGTVTAAPPPPNPTPVPIPGRPLPVTTR